MEYTITLPDSPFSTTYGSNGASVTSLRERYSTQATPPRAHGIKGVPVKAP